jgi:N6-L-threonylcarbamoyladenine synthase
VFVLAIETSCDETAAAIVESAVDADGSPVLSWANPWRIRSNVVASQVDLHREWGGVVPEIASRQHVREICGVVERALGDGGVSWSDLNAVAVTEGPGLIGSLLVGVSFAKSAAWALDKPLVGVNHLAGHIESIWLEHGPIPLPAVVLVVSGGHTSLYIVEREGEYRLLGRTRDDAAGEAYDKVAKLVGLGYPGGPIIDRLAQEGRDDAIRWPVTRLTNPDRNAPERDGRFDFSFSGLKTAVLRHVRERQAAIGGETFPQDEIADLAASFQRRVVETLLDKTFSAARWHGARSIGIAGGVSANSRLRVDAAARATRVELPVYFPRLSLTTDNAAMIAAAGLRKLARREFASIDLNASASLPL